MAEEAYIPHSAGSIAACALLVAETRVDCTSLPMMRCHIDRREDEVTGQAEVAEEGSRTAAIGMGRWGAVQPAAVAAAFEDRTILVVEEGPAMPVAAGQVYVAGSYTDAVDCRDSSCGNPRGPLRHLVEFRNAR